MTITVSITRRAFLASSRRHLSRSSRVKPVQPINRRFQTSLASVQPSYASPPPPPVTSQRQSQHSQQTRTSAPPSSHTPAESIAFGTSEQYVPVRQQPTEETPTSRYNELIESGTLRKDRHQRIIVDRLQALHDQLKNYEQPIPGEIAVQQQTGFFSRLFGSQAGSLPDAPSDLPKGLYLYGDVGTGKSLLMDLFYITLPKNIRRKDRVHFHAFMIDVHKRLHAYKQKHPHTSDLILPIARDLAAQSSVICFDEFQVTDIADAMILRRLLECLLQFGVVFVMTSNRHPTELYKNGIQRSSFLPAIDILTTKFDVVDLDSGTDYRKMPRALSKVYFHPLTPENKLEIDKVFDGLTAHDGPVVQNKKLEIWGRYLNIPESSDNMAKFSFAELCGKPLSAADYIELTQKFRTVFVLDVPKMNLGQKDLARRFITFIDACYENHTKLFVTSEVPIYQVFSDNLDGQSKEKTDHMRSIMDDLGINDQQVGTTSIFNGEEEVFAFARACSRLIQMGTQEWAATAGHEDKHAMIL